MMARSKDLISTTTLLDTLPDRRNDERLVTIQRQIADLYKRQEAERRREKDLLDQLGAFKPVSPLDRLADDLMQDPAASISVLGTHSLRDELVVVQRTLEGVRLAIQRGGEQLLHQEADLDGRACQHMAQLHPHNVRHTLNAMLRLHRSVATQQGLREELNRRGVERTSHLVPHFHRDFVSGLTDLHSYLSGCFREAAGVGFITESERANLTTGVLDELDLNG